MAGGESRFRRRHGRAGITLTFFFTFAKEQLLYCTLLYITYCASMCWYQWRSKTENKAQTKTQQQCVDVDDDVMIKAYFIYLTLPYLTLIFATMRWYRWWWWLRSTAHTYTHTHSLTHSLTHSHTHTHQLSHSLTQQSGDMDDDDYDQKHTHMYTHTHTHSLHTHSLPPSLTLTHSYTHTAMRRHRRW